MIGTLSVRKTLVLGLGSTGLHVAEQLAEHLTWQFGGLDRVAWVRLLVVETAQPPSPLGDRVLWTGLNREEYQPYLNNPRTTGSEFGFYDWQDGPTLHDVDDPSAGAGNCRLLGRLCLFHARNYDNLRRRVTSDLSSLAGLTPQQVADQLGQSGQNVRLDEGGTVVYVVGTLCGGTCSGGAADLGYLIDVWSNHSARRQAIFTLPHPTLAHAQGPRFKKNAYYALKELNHYQLAETRWTQRLPGSESPFVISSRPYDILRVVMPAGGDGRDVKGLNSMIAQYLAAAVGPAGQEIAASDVDATSKMVGGERIGFMKPLFSTMGIAALEYPGEHIQRAATSRLLASSFQRWCNTRAETSSDWAVKALYGLDLEGWLRRLQQGSEAGTSTPFQQLLSGVPEGNFPKAEAIRRALRETDERLSALEPPAASAGAGPPPLVQVLVGNHAALVRSLPEEVQRRVEQQFLEPAAGPGFLAAALKQAAVELDRWLTALDSMLPEARQDAESLRSFLDRELGEVEKLEGNLLVWNKRDKLRTAWDEAAQQLYAWLTAETRTAALQHIQRRRLVQELAEQHRRTTTLPARRLDQVHAAFSQEATALEQEWKELAAFSPAVNGKAYFDAEPPHSPGTVSEEYFKLLRATRWPEEPISGWDDNHKEAAAARAVLTALETLRSELSRDEGQSAFDLRPAIRSARDLIPRSALHAAEERARQFFAPLRDQFHIADRATDADVDTVIQASDPKLSVSATQVSEALAGVPGATPMLSYLAFMELGPAEANPRPALARVQQRVTNGIALRRQGITDSDDPFRLLVLREKHGFTLGQLEGVVSRNRFDNHALQAAESCTDFKFWHTRRDVDWVDPLVPPSQVESTEEGWLLALLLGRPADPALPWLPSTNGEIDAAGWYQLVGGEFYVFYADGLHVGDRGARLPLSFNAAVAKLLNPDHNLLRRTLGMRFASYCERHQHERAIRVLDQAVRSLAVFGLADLDSRQAELILRRAYRRNDRLTQEYFNFRTQNLTNLAEFAHLWRLQGAPIEGRAHEVYPNDGYYCPTCHYILGGTLEQLRQGQFLCTRCNTGERYWP